MTRLLSRFAALILAGCASGSPALFSLESRPGIARPNSARVVIIREAAVPRYLQRPEIVRSAGQDRLVVAENDWWGEPIAAMVQRILVDELAQRLPSSELLAEGDSINARPDVEIEIALQRFDGDGEIVLAGSFAVVDGDRSRHLNRFSVIVPETGITVRDQVEAMNSALAQLADSVAQQLEL